MRADNPDRVQLLNWYLKERVNKDDFPDLYERVGDFLKRKLEDVSKDECRSLRREAQGRKDGLPLEIIGMLGSKEVKVFLLLYQEGSVSIDELRDRFWSPQTEYATVKKAIDRLRKNLVDETCQISIKNHVVTLDK